MKKNILLVALISAITWFLCSRGLSDKNKLFYIEEKETLSQIQSKSNKALLELRKQAEKNNIIFIPNSKTNLKPQKTENNQKFKNKIESLQRLANDIHYLDVDADYLIDVLKDYDIKANKTKKGHPKIGDRYNINNDDKENILINARYNIMLDGTQQFMSFRINFNVPNKYEALRVYNDFLDQIPYDATLLKKTENTLRWEHNNHLVTWLRLDKDVDENYNIKFATEFAQCSHATKVADNYDYLQ